MQADELPRRFGPLVALSLALGVCCGVASAWLATTPVAPGPVACAASTPSR